MGKNFNCGTFLLVSTVLTNVGSISLALALAQGMFKALQGPFSSVKIVSYTRYLCYLAGGKVVSYVPLLPR